MEIFLLCLAICFIAYIFYDAYKTDESNFYKLIENNAYILCIYRGQKSKDKAILLLYNQDGILLFRYNSSMKLVSRMLDKELLDMAIDLYTEDGRS